jgi:hypothetical protein
MKTNVFLFACIVLLAGYVYLTRPEPIDLSSIETRLQSLENLDAPVVNMTIQGEQRAVPVWDIVDMQIRGLADVASSTDKRLKDLEK